MMKNRIYFFSGTGNSLKVARDLAKVLPDCEIVAIYKHVDLNIPSGYDRIGFVFPTYYWGLPKLVANFLEEAMFPKQGNTYYFAITTCGASDGNAICQLNNLLLKKDCQLNYGTKIKMFSNAVTIYEMKKNIAKITEKSNNQLKPIVCDIIEKKLNKISKGHKRVERIYNRHMQAFSTIDHDFNCDDNCISCGICQKICPAKNIKLRAGKPTFLRQCENCQACIQHCPKRSINYKDKTQQRRRYTHPDVKSEELIEYYR